MKGKFLVIFGFMLLAAMSAKAQFDYQTNADGATITVDAYSGTGGSVDIPAIINGLQVTIIGAYAFYKNTNVTAVTIPGTVTNIEGEAFAECAILTNVTMDNGVSTIGTMAFGECPNLVSVTIPGSVSAIGGEAFVGCGKLSSVMIANGVMFIDGAAFFACSNLSTLTIPSTVTGIGEEAFSDCPNLTNVTITNGITTIGNAAFLNCFDLSSITIPGTVTNIGASAFASCRLTSVTIPGSVTTFGENAFGACSSLTNVTIDNGVTSIPEDAFVGCGNLVSVTIPASVTTIGDYAFADPMALQGLSLGLNSIYFEGNAPVADSTVLEYDAIATVYYLAGTTGWSNTFADRPTALWNPATQTGSLQVTITPAAAVTAGGQWHVDGQEWQTSAATVSGLSVGNHTVSFTTISGWTTPANQTISVSANANTRDSATYVPATTQASFLANGLVAYYPFKGNANDASGNGNNGTVVGATLTQDRFGNPNSAYSFDGLSNLITIPDFSEADASAHTLSLWLKANSWTNIPTPAPYVDIFGKDGYNTGPPRQWVCQGKQTGQIRWAVFTSTGEYDLDSISQLQTNQWYQVVTVWDGTNESIFINGIFDSSIPAPGSLVRGTAPVRIGGNPIDGPQFFGGAINDVRMYNRALSSNEVAQLYASEAQPFTFQSVSKTNQTVTLTFYTVAGLIYQVQYSTNLAHLTWNNLGYPLVTAISGFITVPDTNGLDTQRFYRVVQTP